MSISKGRKLKLVWHGLRFAISEFHGNIKLIAVY